MKRVFSTIAMLLLTAPAAGRAADNGSATLFFDGAVVEMEVAAVRGVAAFPLPAGTVKNSLRIRPLGSASIQRVEYPAEQPGRRTDRETETLHEQKSRLEDRLKALEVREKIFTSSAKSQSGKAPRRTKANPDPMLSIRQGTEFAIAQLEAVYTARRRAQQEIRRIDEKLAALGKSEQPGASAVKVRLTPATGRVKVRYALTGTGWSPRYDLLLDEGSMARLVQYASVPPQFEGYRLRASLSTLGSAGQPGLPVAGASGRLNEYRLPVDSQRFDNGVAAGFTLTLRNSGSDYLPAGETALFRNGEYLGRCLFRGISSGRSRVVSSEQP